MNQPAEKTNADGLTFEQWLRKANAACAEACGMSLDDLPDAPTWDAWDAGEDPRAFAREVVREEASDLGFDLDLG